MSGIRQKLAVVLIILTAALVGFFKGAGARQKWVFKIRNKYDHRRLIAEQKNIARSGGVLLDDIELAAYHN